MPNKKKENIICLNKNFSTTRKLTQIEPIIENDPNEKFETTLFFSKSLELSISSRTEGGLRTHGYFKSNLVEHPLVTIITVVYNGKKHLKETIVSVLSQTYDNIEYIVIDGGSTDGTLNIISKYDFAIDYWLSEKDDGIYDAMNKGISLSTGEFIGILNSDDLIYPETVKNVISAFKEKSIAEFTFGKVELATEEGKVYGISKSLPEKKITDFTKDISMPFPHMTMYVKRKLYKSIGLFNTKYKLSADYDFSLKLLKQEISSVELIEPIGFFRRGGRSGGLETWFDTREVLFDHGVWNIFSYRLILSSIIKSFLGKKMPLSVVKMIKKIKKKSKNSFY